MRESKRGKHAIDQKTKEIIDAKYAQTSRPLEMRSIDEMRDLVYELEMQNEALQLHQTQLHETSKRYFDLFDTAPIGYCMLSEDGLIQKVNHTASLLLGVKQTDLIQRPFSDFIHTEYQDTYDQFCKKLLKSLEQETCEVQLIKQAKVPFWAHLSATFETKSTKKLELRLLINDISERKEIKKKLVRKDELEVFSTRLSLALDAGEIGVWDWDIEPNITIWDDRMFEIYGMKKMVPMPYSHWINSVLPADRAAAEATVQRAISTKVRNTSVFRIMRPDNSIRYIESSAEVVVDDFGNVIRVIGINTDITEKKVLEETKVSYELLHKLTENMPGAIYQYRLYPDGSSCSPYSSKGLADVFEVAPQDVLEDVSIVFEHVHPDDFSMVEASIKESARTMQDWNMEFRVQLPKQGLLWLHGRSTPEKLEDGSILWNGFINNITQRKKIEQEIASVNERLTKEVDLQVKKLREQDILLVEQSKLAQMGEMLNMIAHQWRQPLNAMSASAISLSMLNELSLLDKESIEETSKFIQQETQAMSQIINYFMKFNKPENNSEFLLFDSVSQVVNMISSQLKSRNIALEVAVDKKIKIFHNSTSIEHVLLNLIVNSRDAFEYKKIKDKKITISTTVDDDFVALRVEDNAGGIPKNIINKIFNPYFTTKKQGKGTGIGLYMSKQMVESIESSSIDVAVDHDHTLFTIRFKN